MPENHLPACVSPRGMLFTWREKVVGVSVLIGFGAYVTDVGFGKEIGDEIDDGIMEIDLFTRATTTENDQPKKFFVPKKDWLYQKNLRVDSQAIGLIFSRLMTNPELLSSENSLADSASRLK